MNPADRTPENLNKMVSARLRAWNRLEKLHKKEWDEISWMVTEYELVEAHLDDWRRIFREEIAKEDFKAA